MNTVYSAKFSHTHFSIRRIKSINIATSNLIEKKRHALLLALAADHTDSEVAIFKKKNLARSFVFKVRNKLEVSGSDVFSVAKRKGPF